MIACFINSWNEEERNKNNCELFVRWIDVSFKIKEFIRKYVARSWVKNFSSSNWDKQSQTNLFDNCCLEKKFSVRQWEQCYQLSTDRSIIQTDKREITFTISFSNRAETRWWRDEFRSSIVDDGSSRKRSARGRSKRLSNLLLDGFSAGREQPEASGFGNGLIN